jgi:hypothetical protein
MPRRSPRALRVGRVPQRNVGQRQPDVVGQLVDQDTVADMDGRCIEPVGTAFQSATALRNMAMHHMKVKPRLRNRNFAIVRMAFLRAGWPVQGDPPVEAKFRRHRRAIW